MPRVYGNQSKMAEFANREYSEIDFEDRNLSLKKKHLKSVATEDSLDDWFAQSLGIKYEKYMKQKKFIQQIMEDAKKKKMKAESGAKKVVGGKKPPRTKHKSIKIPKKTEGLKKT